MSKMGEEIKQGLREAIEDAKNHNLKRNYIYIEPVKKYKLKEMSQKQQWNLYNDNLELAFWGKIMKKDMYIFPLNNLFPINFVI